MNTPAPEPARGSPSLRPPSAPASSRPQAGSRRARVVIVGAGIVGCSLADELTARGWRDVTVLEQGPLASPGGSTSHAPGLVFRTSPSRTLTRYARYTVEKFTGLHRAGRPCFLPVGGLEVATTEARRLDLYRKAGLAAAWGVEGELVGPARCAELFPMLDPDSVLGGFHTPGDGLARAVDACQAQIERASRRGARFLERHTVTGVEKEAGRVTGVVTDRGTFPADHVVSAAGFWGPVIGAMAGVEVPLLPLAHQYATTAPLPELAGAGTGGDEAVRPILRHQDHDLYYREHLDPAGGPGRIGIGTYARTARCPSTRTRCCPTTRPPRCRPRCPSPHRTSSRAGRRPAGCCPVWPPPGWTRASTVSSPSPRTGCRCWASPTPCAASGSPRPSGSRTPRARARAVAELMTDGRTTVDAHECDPHRFERAQRSPAHVRERGERSFVEVYDVIHPLQPPATGRPLRTSPFYPRQQELGAHFLESGGWERPHWYEANAPLVEQLGLRPAERDPWSARHWSPIAAAEAKLTRERVALYDMTPLRRLEVTGPGSLPFLQRMTSNNLKKRPGSVTYTLLLDESGGIRSDLTAARLGPERWQLGANTPADLDWLVRHAPEDVHVRDITSGTCCIGVWGPLARELVQPLTPADFSHEAFGYFKARETYVGHVPVTALRVSYVGELGWELYADADVGLRLWDTLWEAGQRLGVVAAGRSAFNSLRLEKGYRAWGADMTAEHTPEEAGVGFAVRPAKGDFLGRDALAARSAPERKLVCLTLDDPAAVVLGSEPVQVDGVVDGYVTSASYGYSVGRCVAYAWLPARTAVPGTSVAVEYFGDKIAATVAAEPLFDPEMARIRR